MGEWEGRGKDAGAGMVGSSGHNKAVEGRESWEEQQRFLPEERASSAARAMGGPGQEGGEAGGGEN